MYVLLPLTSYSLINTSIPSIIPRGIHLESRATALNILNHVLVKEVTTRNLGGESGGGLPLGRQAGGSLLHHLVNLLERQTLGLGNKEVGVDSGTGAKRTPEEENLGLEVAVSVTNQVGGDDGNDGVPEPVGSSGQTDTTGADGEREDLANNDPSSRTPGGGEPEDEDGDEGDLGVDGSNVVGGGGIGLVGSRGRVSLVETGSDTNDGHEELADQHTGTTSDEDGTATEALDSPEGQGSGADVNNGEDHGGEENILDSTSRLEEGGGEVEDEVDTGPLLHHLERGTENSAAEVRLGLPERTLEAVGPAAEPSGGGDEGTLVLLVGDNLGDFRLDVLGALRLATEASNGLDSLLNLALLDEVTRGLGEEEKTATENQGPGELDSDGDAVGTSVAAALGSVDNDRSQHDTDGDAELVTRNESTTDLARGNLRHVENDNGGDETNTDTSNETTGNDGAESSRVAGNHLDNNTDSVDDASGNDSPLAAHPISEITSDESTEEGTAGQDRNNEGGVGVSQSRVLVLRVQVGDVCGALNSLDEVLVAENTVDVTRIVTEEDTTEGGKGAENVGLPGNRSFNVLDILGNAETASAIGDVDGLLDSVLFRHYGGGCVVGDVVW